MKTSGFTGYCALIGCMASASGLQAMEIIDIVGPSSVQAGQSFTTQIVLSESTTPLVGYTLAMDIQAALGAQGTVTADLDLTNFYEPQNLIVAGGGELYSFFTAIYSYGEHGAFLTTNSDDLSSYLAVKGVNDVLAEIVWDVSPDASGTFEISLGEGTALSDEFAFPVDFFSVLFEIEIETIPIPLPAPVWLGAVGLAGVVLLRRRMS